jgi:hypothetical protein
MKLKLRNAIYGGIGGLIGSPFANYTLEHDRSLPHLLANAIFVGVSVFIGLAIIFSASPLFQPKKPSQP